MVESSDKDLIKVIALDPGGTTGWAKGLIREGRMGVTSGQDTWNHYQIYEYLRLFKPDAIVCERFDYRKGGKKQEGVELVSREYIGIVHLFVQRRQPPVIHRCVVKLYLQMPTEALGGFWAKDSKLKEDGVFMVGKPHANDAMRHLLQWFQFGPGFRFNKAGFYRLNA